MQGGSDPEDKYDQDEIVDLTGMNMEENTKDDGILHLWDKVFTYATEHSIKRQNIFLYNLLLWDLFYVSILVI